MRMLLLLFLIAPAFALGQDDHSQQCAPVASIPLPQEAQVPKPAVFPVCESYKSYAGIGRSRNYAAARACAWKERAAQQAELPQNPKAITSWVVGGDLILVDLYANGLGVPRNLPLALHLACEDGSGVASDAIEALDKLSSQTQTPKKQFDACDSARSTFSMNFCESFYMDMAKERRRRSIASLERKWTPEQRGVFAKVLAAEEAYVSTHTKELDQGGTIRTIHDLGSADILHNNFWLDLRQFERSILPGGARADVSEQRMTRQYEANLTKARRPIPADQTESAVTANGVKAVQAAWQRYRDAWLSFAAVRYPSTPASAFRSYFAEERYRLLVEMGKEIYRN